MCGGPGQFDTVFLGPKGRPTVSRSIHAPVAVAPTIVRPGGPTEDIQCCRPLKPWVLAYESTNSLLAAGLNFLEAFLELLDLVG